jgi:small subunit ribosomal protein S1
MIHYSHPSYNDLVGHKFTVSIVHLNVYGANCRIVDDVRFSNWSILLHVTDISWKRLRHPIQGVKINDNLYVEVTMVDVKKRLMIVNHKKLLSDPWIGVSSRLKPGNIVSGRIDTINDIAYVEIETGVYGILSDFRNTKYKEGDLIWVFIKSINEDEHILELE